MEDCRDYLRTGRCKYGASCKYNHPANVQSGGGLKGPIDPNEPMFPIRPNEPTCHYFLKHGTCKFGQACKFNHPPQSQQPLKTVINGSNSAAVVINLGRSNEAPQQLLFNQVATDSNGNLMMLQFLPQRPDEPDCIYFLKNKRCKYGATCRYHHPINFNQSRQYPVTDDQRRGRAGAQDPYRTQNVQYFSQLVPAFSNSVNVSSDTQMAYYNQGFQPVQIVAADGTTSYAIPVTEAAAESSASSLASSYETAGSHLELLSRDNTASTVWNRARRNGSEASLNASIPRVSSQSRLQRVTPIQSVASEGNMRQRMRAGSYSSDCNGSQYDTSTMASTTSMQSMSRNTSAGSWRNERPPDPLRRPNQHTQYGAQLPTAALPQRAPQIRDQNGPRRSPRGRSQGQVSEGYEGFTMMTSALLNMLDTPEEAGTNIEDDDDMRYPSASFNSVPHCQSFEEQFDRMCVHADSNNYQGQPPPRLGVINRPSSSSWPSTLHDPGDPQDSQPSVSNGHADHLDHQSPSDVDGFYFP